MFSFRIPLRSAFDTHHNTPSRLRLEGLDFNTIGVLDSSPLLGDDILTDYSRCIQPAVLRGRQLSVPPPMHGCPRGPETLTRCFFRRPRRLAEPARACDMLVHDAAMQHLARPFRADGPLPQIRATPYPHSKQTARQAGQSPFAHTKR